MGKVGIRFLKVVAASVCVLIAIYFVFLGEGSLEHGYSWKEMDWNQDGTTSIGEFFAASDIGKREVILDNKKCIEYFAYKDALPVKTVCPN
jgi:hypothetical protein